MPKKITKKVVTKETVTAVAGGRNFKAMAPKLIVLGLLLIVLVLVGYKNKSLFVAAVVNGQPLWTNSVNSKLMSQYGTQTIDEMVGEMLIRQAAASKKVSVSKVEVDTKLAEIEKSLNGQVTLADALAQQGDTVIF